jgi:type II secretory pathway component PulJ
VAEDEKAMFAKVSLSLRKPCTQVLTAQDSNTGLVHQVVGAVLENKILKTRSLYTRLTIDQLVARVATSRPKSADEVVAKLQEMVSFFNFTIWQS